MRPGRLLARVAAVAISLALVATATGLLYFQRILIERAGIPAHFDRGTTARDPGSVDWRGYLIVPQRDRYRLVAPADGHVWVELDGRAVIDAGMARREARLELARGLHPIRIRGTASAGARALDFRWARGSGVPLPIPPVLFVPDIVTHQEVRRRALVARIVPVALPFCSLLLLAGAAAVALAGLRRLFDASDRSQLGPPALWVAVFLLYAIGMSWGLPDHEAWAPDEVTAGAVVEAVEARFAGGWASIYPPFHYAVLAAATAPYHAAAALGLTDLFDVRTLTEMWLLARLVSVLMALGTLVLIFGLARDIGGTRAGVLAAVVAATILPMAYYAKTANVDVPSVFWLTLSLVFYARTFTRGRPSDFYLFAAAGVAAIGTKDQTYGYYVLPAVYMIGGCLFRSSAFRGVPSPRVLAATSVIALVGLTLVYNVAFNPSGFVEHVEIITGGASQGYRMYPPTLSGQAKLLGTAVVDLGQAMGWPALAAGMIGVVAASRAGVAPIRWLLLPVVSYYLTLIAVVGYHYDRFLLGIGVVLAVGAGWWLDRWTQRSVRWRPWKLAAVGVVLAYGVSRAIGLDVLMLNDSRYAVEDWIVERAGPNDSVAAAGLSSYLPRESKVFWTPIEQDLAALEREKPAFLIVNAAYGQRYAPGTEQHAFYAALASGTAGYVRVLRQHTRLPWSPLHLERRFREGLEDPFSNLTKVNPPIEVYRRVLTSSARPATTWIRSSRDALPESTRPPR